MSRDSAHIFMGMAKLINNDIEHIDYDKLYSICPNLKEINLSVLKIICANYLQWSSLIDIGDPIAMKYPDVYEPMIKLFERGGGIISTHHHELVGGFGAFPQIIYASRGDMREFDISDYALALEIKEVF